MEDLKIIIDLLRPYIEKRRVIETNKNNFLNSTIVASYVKCFEFLDFVFNSSPQNSFFYVPNLRSICEEVIVLSNLIRYEKAEVAQFLLNKNVVQLLGGIKKQNSFLDYAKKYNPRISVDSFTEDEKRGKELCTEFWRSKGFKKINFGMPSTSELAAKVNLSEIYDFIFALTSNSVHFNSSYIHKMGWYQETPDKTYFSIQNYSDYFYNSSIIYGFFLFMQFYSSSII